MKNSITIFLTILIFFLFSLPFLLDVSRANVLGEGYLFFERMQTESPTGMTVMFTPSSTFNSEEEERVFRILLPENEVGEEEWCLQNDIPFTTITSVDSSPVD